MRCGSSDRGLCATCHPPTVSPPIARAERVRTFVDCSSGEEAEEKSEDCGIDDCVCVVNVAGGVLDCRVDVGAGGRMGVSETVGLATGIGCSVGMLSMKPGVRREAESANGRSSSSVVGDVEILRRSDAVVVFCSPRGSGSSWSV